MTTNQPLTNNLKESQLNPSCLGLVVTFLGHHCTKRSEVVKLVKLVTQNASESKGTFELRLYKIYNLCILIQMTATKTS